MKRPEQTGAYPPTHWSLVDRATSGAPEAAEKALEELLGTYRPALLSHLRYAKRLQPELAEDLLQSFIQDKILVGDLLRHADRDRGKFRTFLLTSLNRYIISEGRKRETHARSPGRGALVALDSVADHLEETGQPNAAALFDLTWIDAVLQKVLFQLKEECLASDKRNYWVLFEDRIVNPLLHGAPPSPYDELAARLSFDSPMQASNALITVKRMFRRCLRSVIREYAGTQQAVDEEIADWHAILAQFNA
jgi:DNA-directed RNA polymerase specialized sigma24 family protein